MLLRLTYHLAFVDDYIYLAEGGRGLWLVDRTKLAEGIGSARFINLGNAALNIRVAGRYGFVAGGQPGMTILDYSNPAQPVDIGSHILPSVGGFGTGVWDMVKVGGVDCGEPRVTRMSPG